MIDQVDISNTIVLSIAKLCTSLEVDSQLLQRQIETLDLSNLGGGAVSANDVASIIQFLEDETGRKDLGFLLGDLFEFEYTPEFLTYLQSVNNLRKLIESLSWLGQLFSAHLQLDFEDSNGQVSLYFRTNKSLFEDFPHLLRILIEGVFTYILKQARTLFGIDIPIIEIRLHYPDPGLPALYEQYFSTHCTFNNARSEIIIPSAVIDKPLPGALPALNQKAKESLLKKLNQQQPDPTLSSQIIDLLHQQPELLGANVSVVAEKMLIGERTLQRRLKEEGAQFQQLQDQAKHHCAIDLLSNSKHSIEHISDQLGFSDRRSFSRAFQRWQGCTPSQFRSQ